MGRVAPRISLNGLAALARDPRERGAGRLPAGGGEMSTASIGKPQLVNGGGEVLWFLGTLARMKLDGKQTGGRFSLWEATAPHGAAPPLHSHPQDETFFILEGEITPWIVEPEMLDGDGDPRVDEDVLPALWPFFFSRPAAPRTPSASS